jgi:hypothetical protein
MPNENDSCYDCKWSNVDADCSQIAPCKNFKRKDLDRIADTQDCVPLGVVEMRAAGLK